MTSTVVEGKGALSERSSLKHRWLVLNDSTSPIELFKTGIFTGFESTGSVFKVDGVVDYRQDVRAYDLIFVLFNVWDEHMRNLRDTIIRDGKATGEIILDEDQWYATATEASQMRTSVVFVDRVLLADGTIWRADRGAIARKVGELNLHLSDDGVDPPKPPKPDPPGQVL